MYCNLTPTTVTITLPLHDALPIFRRRKRTTVVVYRPTSRALARWPPEMRRSNQRRGSADRQRRTSESTAHRSEEHTSELQSPCNLVCRLLLEKKKKKQKRKKINQE